MKKIVGYTIAAALLMPTNVAFANEAKPVATNVASVASTTTTNVATDINELKKLVKSQLDSYETQFVLHLESKIADEVAFKQEMKDYFTSLKTVDPYVGYLIKEQSMKIITSTTSNRTTIVFTVGYHTTKQQELLVDNQLTNIAKSIFVKDMSEFEKVKAVNDYIVSTSSFTNETTASPNAAYTLINEKKGVSQAYALLAYRLLQLKVVETTVSGKTVTTVEKDPSFQVEIIDGSVENGIPHVWNIVKVDGQTYHLDTSWNDSYPNVTGEVKYDYFLQSDTSMGKTHKWTSYTTSGSGEYDAYRDAVSPVKVEGKTLYASKQNDFLLYDMDTQSEVLPKRLRVKALAYDNVNDVLYFSNYTSKGDLYKVHVINGALDVSSIELVQSNPVKSLRVDEKNKVLYITYLNGGTSSLPLKSQVKFDEDAAKPVIAAIAALGNPATVPADKVNLTNFAKAEAMYFNLTSSADGKVTNADNLDQFGIKLNPYPNQTAAYEVMRDIFSLNELDADFAVKVKDARTAYDALTVDQKKLVTNLTTLTAAEAKVKSNLATTLSIDEAIVALKPNVSGFYNAVAQIRTRYEVLTEPQKKLIVKYDELLAAENTAKEDMQKANSFDYRLLFLNQTDADYEAKVRALRDEYDNTLSLNVKSLVKTISKLTQAEKNVADNAKTIEKWKAKVDTLDALQTTIDGYGKAIYSLRAEYDKFTTLQKSLAAIGLVELQEHEAYIAQAAEAAAPVIALIAELNVNMSNIQTKIDEAKNAYNALAPLPKECVTNYDRIADIEKWLVYKKDIDRVESLISKIVKGSSSYKANTYAARFAYNALTDYAKSKVSNYAILQAAEKDIQSGNTDGETEGEVTEENEVYTITGAQKNNTYTFDIPSEVVREAFTEDGNATVKLSVKNNIQVTIPANAINDRAAQHASAKVTVEVRKNNDIVVDLQLMTAGKETSLLELHDYVTIELPIDNVFDDYGDFVVLRDTENDFAAIPFKVTSSDKLVIKARSLGRYVMDTKNIEFRDLGNSSYASDVQFLANRRIVKGTTETTYSPSNTVTRAQFAAMLARALDLKPKEKTSFNDIKGKWYESDVQALKEFGVINGVSENRFNPSGKLTRQQAALMIYRMIEKSGYDLNNIDISNVSFKDDYLFNSEVNEAVKTLYVLDVISGKPNGKFDPYDYLTRGQMAKILRNSLETIEFY